MKKEPSVRKRWVKAPPLANTGRAPRSTGRAAVSRGLHPEASYRSSMPATHFNSSHGKKTRPTLMGIARETLHHPRDCSVRGTPGPFPHGPFHILFQVCGWKRMRERRFWNLCKPYSVQHTRLARKRFESKELHDLFCLFPKQVII